MANRCPFVVSDRSGRLYYGMNRAVNILNEAVTADNAGVATPGRRVAPDDGGRHSGMT